MGVRDSYVWKLVFLRLRVSNPYFWGLIFLRFGACALTFGGEFSYVWGLGILAFKN